MIVTLTCNPAVDQTAWVDELRLGAINQVREVHLDPAGKGVNVSRVAHRLGFPTIALGFVGGETGDIIEHSLECEGVQHHFIRVAGRTRVNLTVVDGSGMGTSFRGPGPEVPPERLAALEEVLQVWLRAATVLVLAGTLPGGMSADAYARYIRSARERGVETIVDADGEALRLSVDAGPDVIKPNLAEAERLVGRSLPGIADAVGAARELVRAGVGVVVISMGPVGAVCAKGERTWHAVPPRVERRSTVGSGDAMVAGLAAALSSGGGIEAGLRLGTAAGAATAATPGTALGTSAAIHALLSKVRVDVIG